MRHLGEEKLASLHRQHVHEEIVVVVDQLEPEVVTPDLEEPVAKDGLVRYLVFEPPIVAVAVVISGSNSWGRINAMRGRQLCAIGAVNERNRGNLLERGMSMDGLWSGTLQVKLSAGQD